MGVLRQKAVILPTVALPTSGEGSKRPLPLSLPRQAPLFYRPIMAPTTQFVKGGKWGLHLGRKGRMISKNEKRGVRIAGLRGNRKVFTQNLIWIMPT